MSVHRATRVAEAIKVEVGNIILFRLKDSRVASERVSVMNVEVTGDLCHATVFVSIRGDDEQQAVTLKGLVSASGYIRSEIGKAIKLRVTPEVHFKLDHSLEHASNIAALLNRIKEEQKATDEAREAASSDDEPSRE